MKPVTPLLAVDAIIKFNGKIVLIKRKNQPYQGKYALPGGFAELGETLEQAVTREAKEETGLDIEIIKLVGVYSEPVRDPRGHTVSVAYLAQGYGVLMSGSDAAAAELFDVKDSPELAFDHNIILRDALK